MLQHFGVTREIKNLQFIIKRRDGVIINGNNILTDLDGLGGKSKGEDEFNLA